MFRLRNAAAVAGALLVFAGATAAAQVPVKMTGPTINDSLHQWMLHYKERIEKAAPGKYVGEVYPASQLGAIPRMIEGLQLGSIELALLPPDFLVGVDKRFGVLGAPVLLDDMQHGYRAYHTPEAQAFFGKLAESKGLKMVGNVCDGDTAYGFRTPYQSFADFKGKKIRVFPSAMERTSLGKLGASPAPMPPDEVLPALQQGVIDGAKSGITVFLGFKYQTVAKYLVRTQETMICSLRLMSKLWFDKQPADMQKLFLEEAAKTDEWAQALANDLTERQYREWAATGGEMRNLTADESAELKRLLGPVGEEVVKADPDLREAYTVWKQATDSTRK